MNKQRGYINIPAGTMSALFFCTLVGLLSMIGGFCYLVYWLATHLRWA